MEKPYEGFAPTGPRPTKACRSIMYTNLNHDHIPLEGLDARATTDRSRRERVGDSHAENLLPIVQILGIQHRRACRAAATTINASQKESCAWPANSTAARIAYLKSTVALWVSYKALHAAKISDGILCENEANIELGSMFQ